MKKIVVQHTEDRTIVVKEGPRLEHSGLGPAHAPGSGHPPRILVRGLNWVGDAVMSTPALAELRRVYPDAHITLLARPWVAAIYEHNPQISELWVADDAASSVAFLKAVARMRKGRFQIGLILPNAFRSALLMKLGGVGYRIGYDCGQRGWLLSRAVPIDPDVIQTHQVYSYVHLVEALSGKPAPVPKLELYAGDVEREEVARLLVQLGLDRNQPLVGMAPGSMNSNAKRWLPERFAELADRLHQAAGAEILLLGSPHEQDLMDRVAALCKTRAHNLGGKLSLSQLIALLERLQGLISNDAGAMHAAAALRVPTVAIFGPTDYTTAFPFCNVARIVHHHVDCAPCNLRECPIPGHPCMTGVSVEQVAEAFKTVVREARNAASTPPQPVLG